MGIKTGVNQLHYQGVQPRTPPEWVTEERAPTVHDYKDYFVGTFWLQLPSKVLWFLANKWDNQGEWINLTTGAAAGLLTLTGDVGLAVGADIVGNIDVLGVSGQTLVTGNPGVFNLTISLDSSVAQGYLTDDANTAVPVANILKVYGTGGISTSSSGNILTIDGSGASGLIYYQTDSGQATPAANTLNVPGDATFIATSGAGNTLTYSIASSVGDDGEVIIGKTGGLPAWNNITSLDGTVIITNGPNTIDLVDNSGGSPPPISTGTFVPDLKFGGATTGITYTSRWGYYTLVGNTCFINAYIALSSKGTATGYATLDGFPFANLPYGTNFVTKMSQNFFFNSGFYEFHSTFDGTSLTYIQIGMTSLNGTFNVRSTNSNFRDDTILSFYGQYFI